MSRQSPMSIVERRAQILAAALRLAARSNYRELKRADVARAAGVAVGTVSHACGSMAEFRRLLIAFAVANGHAGVVAQGIASRDPIAINAPQTLKDQAVKVLTQ